MAGNPASDQKLGRHSQQSRRYTVAHRVLNSARADHRHRTRVITDPDFIPGIERAPQQHGNGFRIVHLAATKTGKTTPRRGSRS